MPADACPEKILYYPIDTPAIQADHSRGSIPKFSLSTRLHPFRIALASRETGG